LFARNQGDTYLQTTVSADSKSGSSRPASLICSCVTESTTGDIILKLVNLDSSRLLTQIAFKGGQQIDSHAALTILAVDPRASNTFDQPRIIVPRTSEFQAGQSFQLAAPPHSLLILRVKAR